MFNGVLLAFLSGICNGLFTTPMKFAGAWRWENIWLVFILVACIAMPAAMVFGIAPSSSIILSTAPASAVRCALGFGFAWGFGAICFGRSVDRLGVSLANSIVIGVSSAFGSLVPLFMRESFHIGQKEIILFTGVLAFLGGVGFCGKAGHLRDGAASAGRWASRLGLLFAAIAGFISAVFNIGYTLALPIAEAGVRLGYSQFAATNWIWLLMLGAGAIPNIFYCMLLLRRNRTSALFSSRAAAACWWWAALMGLLWSGSIFLYGAATPRLGTLGPSVGWPLSLAVGLLLANGMGLWLGEWRDASRRAVLHMRLGILLILVAVVFCSVSIGIDA